jgi:PTS system galactitol-specific IIA component
MSPTDPRAAASSSTAGLPPRFQASLCFMRPDVTTGVEAIRLLASAAVDQGFAHASFVDAVVEREREHPTGLPVPTPVAIPHADAHHILRPALAALVPSQPLLFGEMGSRDRTVEAELVVMMLVSDPQGQVPLLGRLLGVLRRPDLGEVVGRVSTEAELAGELDALLEV